MLGISGTGVASVQRMQKLQLCSACTLLVEYFTTFIYSCKQSYKTSRAKRMLQALQSNDNTHCQGLRTQTEEHHAQLQATRQLEAAPEQHSRRHVRLRAPHPQLPC